MKNKWQSHKILWVILLFLVACSPEVTTVEVEVTRVVTETVVEEGVEVEVTRVVEEVVEVVVTPLPDTDNEDAPDGQPFVSIGSEELVIVRPTPISGGKITSVARVNEDSITNNIETAPSNSPEPDRTTLDETNRIVVSPQNRLTAGNVNDNQNHNTYLRYLADYPHHNITSVDVSLQHIITMVDATGTPLIGQEIRIETEDGVFVTNLRTQSQGHVYFHPLAYTVQAEQYLLLVEDNAYEMTISMTQWDVRTSIEQRHLPTLDLLFLLDTTDSMDDQLNALRNNLSAIVTRLKEFPNAPEVRLALVAYRDEGEVYETQTFNFTADVETFVATLEEITASGGGDYPEAVQQGLQEAVNGVRWQEDGSLSLIFLIGDAPPHLDDGLPYMQSMQQALSKGIRIYPIASSGLDAQGEYIFRQLAQFTGGEFIFLTYGGGASESTGEQTDFVVSDYTVSDLDALIWQIIMGETGLE